jgi:pimeloyl-ACP methyl ester carboxylesterase
VRDGEETKGTEGSGGALVRSLLRISGAVLLAVGFLLYPFFYFMQERLIFVRQGITPEEREGVRRSFPHAEEMTLATQDGVTLHGWFLKGDGETPAPLLLYFGGNAEEVSTFLPEAEEYAALGYSVVLMNYRGYGLSGGRPGESALTRDARLIYDTFTGKDGVDPGRVAVMGRSLGTGVAVSLASERPASGLVLISPYDSLVSVAGDFYPWAPVGLILRHRFDSLALAPSMRAPALMIVASDDEVIHPEHTHRLGEAWAGPVTLVTVEGEGHNTLWRDPRYREGITGFLRKIREEPAP